MSEMKKVAVVTGAGTGIGRAVACGLIESGYRVALAGRRIELLNESADCADQRDQVLVVQTDVTDPDSVKKLFLETVNKFGRIDLLFNNAGIGAPAVEMDELGIDQWKAVVETNLTGVFLCTREAFGIMKRQDPCGGRIINNGSVSAHSPRPYSAPYTATKHAVTGLTKSTSLDGRKHNIACGQIDIGNASTPMTERMAKGVPQADGSLSAEPTIDPDAVVRAVLYMDSLPLDANVLNMTVMANQMPFVGRG